MIRASPPGTVTPPHRNHHKNPAQHHDQIRLRGIEARPGLGEHVDGLHHSGVGGLVQGGDPVAYLVDEVDLPLLSIHPSSIADSILRWVRGPWFGPSGGELVPAPDARFGWASAPGDLRGRRCRRLVCSGCRHRCRQHRWGSKRYVFGPEKGQANAMTT